MRGDFHSGPRGVKEDNSKASNRGNFHSNPTTSKRGVCSGSRGLIQEG